jgi:hypothetical protein
MAAQTPNDAEFSIAAKILLCSGRILPPGGILAGWTSPTGERVSFKTLAETIVIAELDWLVTAGHAQIWEAERKHLIGSMPTIMVRSLYSSAPGGFGTRFLEATGWVDADLMDVVRTLIGRRSHAPLLELLSSVEDEYRAAGILHGNAWDARWRDYLVEQWGREAWDTVQRTDTLPWREAARRTVGVASGSLLESDDD